ncbi:hypothetical protein EAI_11455 [Harpegnathos saltator]|uniref:Uncharacterized protein n=1 Tax=Harpegnathos saltator TaxID=610380 RepID=E2BS12_HARSA|nr:hypothetical protein EAI_11455 [Harpegnathos saltator]
MRRFQIPARIPEYLFGYHKQREKEEEEEEEEEEEKKEDRPAGNVLADSPFSIAPPCATLTTSSGSSSTTTTTIATVAAIATLCSLHATPKHPGPRDIKMDQGTVQSCAVVALIRQVVELLRECYLNMLIPTWPVGAHPKPPQSSDTQLTGQRPAVADSNSDDTDDKRAASTFAIALREKKIATEIATEPSKSHHAAPLSGTTALNESNIHVSSRYEMYTGKTCNSPAKERSYPNLLCAAKSSSNVDPYLLGTSKIEER